MRDRRPKLLVPVAVLFAALAPAALLALDGEGELQLEKLAGGSMITLDASERAYQQPAPTLTSRELKVFTEGREAFGQHWVVAPSVLGLWGRGPTSNGEACTDCHENGGRGIAPSWANEPLQSMLVRLSVPGAGARGAPRPDPDYGDQLQEEGILGRVPAEGHAVITWSEIAVTLADSETVRLRKPHVDIRDLAFGPLAPGIMLSARVAPPMIGVGLLDAVSEETILENAQTQERGGVHGHANRVWDVIEGRQALGRFGYKANQPSLKQQILSAYHADLGVTSRWFPQEHCTAVQVQCRAEPPGGHPELPELFLDAVLLYARTLAVPARRGLDDPQVTRGEILFSQAGCGYCHLPELKTGAYAPLPALSHQVIHAYTDLLVHDMGDGLADGRPDFTAGPREWRTAPLWGMGLSQRVNGHGTLLHDGRARNPIEAILWHGGEAEPSREAFRRMPKPDRNALIAFLQSL